MTAQYPGIMLTDMARRRTRVVWLLVGLLAGVGGVIMIAESLIALTNGDTASTSRVRGLDLPTWSLGLLALAVVPAMWWAWRREAGANVKRDGVINIQPVQGGLYLIGNYGSAKGVSLPVQDHSALRISLVKTRVSSYGLVKLYGLRMTSANGTVLMDLQLMPKALDLSPLMAELRRRRISVELDPALDTQHDHGAAPHVAPPSGPVGQAYQSAPPTAGWTPQ